MSIRMGYADTPHGVWITNWIAEQLTHERLDITIERIVVADSLAVFAGDSAILEALEHVDLIVCDGAFLPVRDAPGLIVAAVCDRADPRHMMRGDGEGVQVWHPALEAFVRHSNPEMDICVRLSLIDSAPDVTGLTFFAPSHVVARTGSARDKGVEVEAEDLLPVACQGSVFVYGHATNPELGKYVYETCNHSNTRREVTVERYFMSLLSDSVRIQTCCLSTSSDRFLYLFVSVVINGVKYITRSSSSINAPEAVVAQAIQDLERQSTSSIVG